MPPETHFWIVVQRFWNWNYARRSSQGETSHSNLSVCLTDISLMLCCRRSLAQKYSLGLVLAGKNDFHQGLLTGKPMLKNCCSSFRRLGNQHNQHLTDARRFLRKTKTVSI